MKQYHAEILEDQTVNIDTKAVRKSGIVADGSLTSWLYVHWDTLKDFIRRITGINNVIRVKAVFTTNITIGASGTAVDGYTILNNDIVLVAGQTDTTQNGLYTWATGGALTRLAPFTSTFAAGLAILNIALQGRIFHVLNGNINRNTFWYFDCATQFPVIGTSSLLFYNVANLKVSTASNNLIVQGTDGIEVKIRNTGADIFGGLQFDPTTREFYIITSTMPGASGSLTIENYLGTILGVAAKMRFGIEFTTVWDAPNSRITISTNKDLATNITEDFVHQFLPTNVATHNLFRSGLIVASLGGLNGNHGTGDVNTPSEITTYTDVLGWLSRLLPTAASQVIYYIHMATAGFFLSARILTSWTEKVRFINGAIPTNTALMSFQTGFCDLTSATINSWIYANDGLYFYLVQTENGGRLQAVAGKAGVYTKVDTGITITSGQYYKLKVEWNGTDARYYNGTTLLATITTNLPIVALYPFSRLAKSATTSPSNYEVRTDSVDFKYERI